MKIILLPGLDGTGLFLTDFAAQLSTRYRVQTLSYPPDLSTYPELTDYVRAQLPQEDFILLAESFSGPIAIEISNTPPNGQKGTVFVATFAKRPRAIPAWVSGVLKYLPLRSPQLARLAQPFVMGKWSTATATKTLTDTLQRVPARTVANRLNAVLTIDVADKIPTMTVPFRYFKAAHDRLVPAKNASDFAIYSGVVVNIDGPHFLLQANPQRAADALVRFVETLG